MQFDLISVLNSLTFKQLICSKVIHPSSRLIKQEGFVFVDPKGRWFPGKPIQCWLLLECCATLQCSPELDKKSVRKRVLGDGRQRTEELYEVFYMNFPLW